MGFEDFVVTTLARHCAVVGCVIALGLASVNLAFECGPDATRIMSNA